MTDNIKLPPLPVSANFYGMYGEYTKSQVEALMREAVRLNAQATSMQWPKPEDVTPEMLNAFRSAYKEGDFWKARIHGALCAMLSAAPAAPQPRDDGMPASSDERHLRRLLAVRVAMPNTYFDDGEAHGAEHGIQIDFMREPVAHIDAKLRALNVARLAVAAPQPAQQPLTDAEIKRIATYAPEGISDDDVADIVRRVERMHGIGIKND